jgi:hypothetical protein
MLTMGVGDREKDREEEKDEDGEESKDPRFIS